MSINVDLMEKGELQRMCVKLFNQFEDFKNSSIDHLQRLKIFEIEKEFHIEKIKSLEDALMNSKPPLEKPFDSSSSIDSVASVSHAMPAYRTMFVKPSMSQHHTHSTCGDKGKSNKGTRPKNFNFIPTCHHYGVSGHICPNCFQIRCQKSWDKLHVPRKDEPGIENQVKNLIDQVKLITEKLGSLTPNEKKSVLVNIKKNTSNKQVWITKEDNLCLVAHIALKILDTCLWYLDSGCSKHMTGDKTLLKDVQMGRGGRITYRDGS
jgi:ribosomal protein L32